MRFRALLLTTTLFGSLAAAHADPLDDTIRTPVLHATVTVASDVVRIGDLIDNAGSAAQIAVYRAPDLGTTGAIPTAQVLTTLRAHQVIGVNAKDIKEVAVTRLARNIAAKDIQAAVAKALEHRSGLGDADNLALGFDRDLQDLHLEANNTGDMQPTSVRVDQRSGRFDVTFEIANGSSTPTQLRYTGTAIETVQAAVLTRDVERTELLKSSDIMIERRPRAEVGSDAAVRDQAVGMQMRHGMRAGRPLRVADLVRPDLVQRDQTVTVIYQTDGIYLTTRGKALDSGTEGDVVSVLNAQSKRTVTGVVSGRGQVTIQVATPAPVYVSDTSAIPPKDQSSISSAPVSVADGSNNPQAPVKPE
ncbi:flagellar basal body P-ring formation chaperone FlgA [Bradyrhizobium sp. Tv2a-2]|uniref:flagellar basal body P-ring formation chaperone FlgA n=1 Tax=Bradyrhizobium sp. Tv2a-2 TaxID=113395 RepID=UPI000402DC67|nr:flagellar basal body P-ring formation chaperone FlgA [Bradyrhizobium sp. Tv2a-2]